MAFDRVLAELTWEVFTPDQRAEWTRNVEAHKDEAPSGLLEFLQSKEEQKS